MTGSGVGIFLDQQAGGGMLNEYRAQAGIDSGVVNGLIDLPSDFMQSLSCGVDGKLSDHGIIMAFCCPQLMLLAKACDIRPALSSLYHGNAVNSGGLVFGVIKLLSSIDKLFRKLSGLSSMALMLVLSWPAGADTLVQQHHQQQRGCHACHTQRLPLVADSNHCNRCHTQADDENMVAVVPAVAAGAAKTSVTTAESPVAGLAPGMVLPMYYADSRIGSAPNPMISIPAGDFIMGSDKRMEDEGPQYLAHSGAYRIDVYEVTNLQYKKFIDDTHRRSPGHFRNRRFPEGKADHPVTSRTGLVT